MTRKGEISIGILVTSLITIGIAVAGFFGNTLSKTDNKAQKALDTTAELISIVRVTQNDVQWIKEQMKALNQSRIPLTLASTTTIVR